MNKKGQELNLLGQALLFVILFFVGGFIGFVSLPEFPGRFYVSGIIFGLAATGFVNIIIHWHYHG